MSDGAPRAVWAARLGALDPRAAALNDSLPVDRRLWLEELALTRAYAASLVECGVMRGDEAQALATACAALKDDLVSGATALAGEDVHSAVEAELARRCGEPARRLHTGRSRNDQVATLMRMHVARLCDTALERVRELERALVLQARTAGTRAVAAYTHLQPAQPVLLAHWWLAHVAAFERDEARLQSAREAADVLPLGAGAIAGTPLQYDRTALATRLGFSRLAENSMDAVSDRDFALEYLQAAAVLGVHLSRLAEDLVLWCSPGFGWFRPPHGFSTGSSLLPQKRNPDVFELARGKSARLVTNAERLAVLLKSLPAGYQKDLQEDKEAVFDSGDTLERVLDALAPAVATLEAVPERMRESLTPDLLAVELADALVEGGTPFRDAHATVGRLWAAAEHAGVAVAALPVDERLAISPAFTDERLAALTVESALARRNHAPGAGPASVAAQLERAESRLGIGGGEFATVDGGASSRSSRSRPDRTPRALRETREARESQEAKRAKRSEAEPWMAEPNGSPGMHAATDPAATQDRRMGARERAKAESTQAHAHGTIIRRATLADVPGIAGVMADYVIQGVLLPRPVSELYQCIREFHVAERDGAIVGCAALRVLWDDLGEVRSLAIRPDQHGRGLGQALVEAVMADARDLAVTRVIALTRELPFFERCGFRVVQRDTLPRKVWTDCVRCPRRHACDEVAVVFDLVPGATAAADAAGRSWTLPIPLGADPPPLAEIESALPIVT